MAGLPNSSQKRSRSRQDIADLDKAEFRLTKRRHPNAFDTREQTRPTSSSSGLVPDPEEWNGDGDDDALYNLFATAPPERFATIPRPHGARGLEEPWWELRDDPEIYLSLDFPTPERPMHRQEKDRTSRLRGLHTRFRSALEIYREEDVESHPASSGYDSHWASSEFAVTQEKTIISREKVTLQDGSTVLRERTVHERITWSRSPTRSPHSRSRSSLSPSTELQRAQEEQDTASLGKAKLLVFDNDNPVKVTIEATSRRVRIRARDVSNIVKNQHADSALTRRDIYNARALIKRQKLDSYNPTAALIKIFDEKGVPYVVKWSEAEPSRLVGLVWTFPYCIRMWQRFSEVLSFDNTYNTNRFKLPLFQATGQTCLGTVFNAAFGLVDNERLEGFQFLADGIRQFAIQHNIRLPDTILTDFGDQMKQALNEQFPESQQQICIHHIISNVLLEAKQKWIRGGTDDGSDQESATENAQDRTILAASDRAMVRDSGPSQSSEPIPHTYQGVVMLWKLVMFAETEAEHDRLWADVCKEFGEQKAILLYLYRTYMSVREQWARCFIRKYRNFGCRVTSGTEASNDNSCDGNPKSFEPPAKRYRTLQRGLYAIC
ncbi:hypothetical protein CHGG_08713 [Chaetomium globosum CBS 148.51]|uniref:MULE transposase domain-containing protein n=1 Tax=Chaetomium globosum (strain ATCC 6205 / CBS 148.51 / DSM 1962 / NBRC 6347 / NRRL 1970) TaxID=306901 RepID=Q2GTJ1_CHAGB|nr:uncharacterized protein CHGG_08713 [Chaetomium globosum CBS 148.51]EAQ84699.1 hypothetical protein CHGG_08713 [Chaetomium globosum CBS 148.51]